MGPGTDLGGLGWFAVVWATMMAAMMLPSLVPMALDVRAGRAGPRSGRPTAAAAVFTGGYLLDVGGCGNARVRGGRRAFARSTSRSSPGTTAAPTSPAA